MHWNGSPHPHAAWFNYTLKKKKKCWFNEVLRVCARKWGRDAESMDLPRKTVEEVSWSLRLCPEDRNAFVLGAGADMHMRWHWLMLNVSRGAQLKQINVSSMTCRVFALRINLLICSWNMVAFFPLIHPYTEGPGFLEFFIKFQSFSLASSNPAGSSFKVTLLVVHYSPDLSLTSPSFKPPWPLRANVPS